MKQNLMRFERRVPARTPWNGDAAFLTF
jgi:hypothetical protein